MNNNNLFHIYNLGPFGVKPFPGSDCVKVSSISKGSNKRLQCL